MTQDGLDDDQPQPQPPAGTGFDDALLQRGDRRGARTVFGRAPAASPRRALAPQLKAAQELRPPPQPWSKTPMRDDDDDGGDRPEDPTVSELGPPWPSTDEADYPQDVRAAWAAHDDEVERKVYGEEGDDDVAVYEAHLAQVRERDPPR